MSDLDEPIGREIMTDTSPGPIQVLIVYDSVLVRRGLVAFLLAHDLSS